MIRPQGAPPPVHAMTDDDLVHELYDWAEVVRQENGDVGNACWRDINLLLDEIVDRHPELRYVPA